MTTLESINAQIEALEAQRAELYKASVDAPTEDKLCPDWMAEMLSEPIRSLRYPITVRGIAHDGKEAVATRYGLKKPGIFVAVRPCDKECAGKTYLGVYIGDIATSASARFHPETGILDVGLGFHNPAMWVPDLNRIVWGMGSWWGEIESEADLRQISDMDIENVWYVKALRSLGGGA